MLRYTQQLRQNAVDEVVTHEGTTSDHLYRALLYGYTARGNTLEPATVFHNTSSRHTDVTATTAFADSNAYINTCNLFSSRTIATEKLPTKTTPAIAHLEKEQVKKDPYYPLYLRIRNVDCAP